MQQKEWQKENSRSLHCATPDFLFNWVALANFMRLSSQKAAHAVVARSRAQEIRVRFGRDDNFVEEIAWIMRLDVRGHNKIVIPTEA
jgi:hypothetical protein